MHREVYERAYRFKLEFQYDFIQWNGTQTKKNTCSESHGYLFADDTGQNPPGTPIGACGFWKEPYGWQLMWIWICPKMRRSGISKRRWQRLMERYGDFAIEAPLSNAMRDFILRHGTEKQRAFAATQSTEQ